MTIEKEIYITRGSNASLTSRGLQCVYIWMHEPCLNIEYVEDDMFSDVGLEMHKKLDGILYGKNCKYNFIYRDDRLIRNPDGIDMPQILIDMMYDRELIFTHDVFGSGRKVGFRKISVGDLIGYDNDIADVIWEMVTSEFGSIPMLDWDKHEKEIPWWRFCKKMKIKISI